MRLLLNLLLLLVTASAFAQGEPIPEATKTEVYSTSNCLGCHGQSAMGGLGPPIAKTKLTYDQFLLVVRKGKGMMPATNETDMPDTEVSKVYAELQAKPYNPDQIPIAYKVSQALTTRNVALMFLAAALIAFAIGSYRLVKWVRPTSIGRLFPSMARFGFGKCVWIVVKSLVVDGLFVSSLWKANKHRWFMHGLMLYGFLGLLLADVLMSIYNPTRGDLPLLSPLKVLPVVSGGMLLLGVMYVMYRYRSDKFIDNGLTLSGDFLFVNLMFHSVLAGFLTLMVARLNLSEWVMTVYIYHLTVVMLLIITAPFSRFQHAWVVPILASITRLTEAVSASGVNIGFEREPSPGRHHKSLAIVDSVMESLGPDYEDKKVVLRYFP
ncbi:MAG TPA: c-type cytochrome [Fimbriimonadaceae bacterium]|nr:c-type cytochrome [Fimbriimonadaceae bacterium]